MFSTFLSSRRPLLLHLPTPSEPIFPFQVWLSVPTLTLKSPRRMSLSVRGVAEIILSNSSWNLSFTSSGLVIVGAWALTMIACLLPDKGSLKVIRRSLMPLGNPLSFLTRSDLMAKPTPASRLSSLLRPRQRMYSQRQLL